jgi:hypothetical protein
MSSLTLTLEMGVGGMSSASGVASLETVPGRVPDVEHTSDTLAASRGTVTYLPAVIGPRCLDTLSALTRSRATRSSRCSLDGMVSPRP